MNDDYNVAFCQLGIMGTRYVRDEKMIDSIKLHNE